MICSAEFNLRYDRIRDFLNKNDLGALLAFSPAMEHKWLQTGHVSYLSGWANHDRLGNSVVVVPANGKVALLFEGLPYMIEQAAEVSPIEDIRTVSSVDPNAVSVHVEGGRIGGFAGETLEILSENGLAGKPVGVVGIEAMPIRCYEAIRNGLGNQFREIDDIVAELRSIKTADEIEALRQAAHLSDLGFETMLEMARPGMRGIELVAEMERVARRLGADHAKYWMASGPPPDWNDVRLDIKPHDRVLQDGDLMGACSYIVYKGYWCHGHRAGALGRMPTETKPLFDLTRRAQDRGLAKVKPGTTIGEVVEAIGQTASEGGLPMMDRAGHGIGMDYSEQPVPVNKSSKIRLAAGMTMVIHSIFELPGTGNMIVPYGDMIHVTDNGPELLMKFPNTAFIAGQ